MEVYMRGVNRVMLVGRAGRDAEARNSANGLWCNFSLATGKARREGSGWVEDTDWHRVKVFGSMAEIAERMVKKGVMVAVEGAVHYEAWNDDAGQKRTSAVIVADNVQILSRPTESRRVPHADQEIPEFTPVDVSTSEIAEAK
jgi:single-strand DNA-binding protein